MTTFNVDGKEYVSGKIPLRLGCEAERMLKVQLGEGGFAMTMIELYVAMRQAEPDLPPHVHADKVLAADFLTVYDVVAAEDEGEASDVPLDEPAPEAETGDDTGPVPAPEEPVDQVTSGRRALVS